MQFVLYVVAYLDRINVGFAALEMNRELGLSSEQYGLLSGIFFCGYFLFGFRAVAVALALAAALVLAQKLYRPANSALAAVA